MSFPDLAHYEPTPLTVSASYHHVKSDKCRVSCYNVFYFESYFQDRTPTLRITSRNHGCFRSHFPIMESRAAACRPHRYGCVVDRTLENTRVVAIYSNFAPVLKSHKNHFPSSNTSCILIFELPNLKARRNKMALIVSTFFEHFDAAFRL